MLDTFSLTASESEAIIIAELKACLLELNDTAFESKFEKLIANVTLISKIDRYLSRDDNALIVDLLAELSATAGLRDGHLIGSSVILADKLFLEPMYEKIGSATYPINFAQTVLDFDDSCNHVQGSGLIRSIGRSAQTLMVLVRGSHTGKMNVVALSMKDLQFEHSTLPIAPITFQVNARPIHFRRLNESGVSKAIKEVCVSNFSIALGVLRSARFTTEEHAKMHMLFGKPLIQHHATQMRLSQGVVNEELLRVIAIRQHSEYGALVDQQAVTVYKVRNLIQHTLTDMAHLHGAESVLARTSLPLLDLKLLTLGLIDDYFA